MSAYTLDAWAEFAVATAGAAAVLAGLIFISVSINLEPILAFPGLPGRAGESLIMLLAVLVLATLMLVPQSERAPAIEILITGIVYVVGLLLIAVPGARASRTQPLAWRITRVVSALAAGLPAVVAGASLLAEEGGGAGTAPTSSS
jgi:hypothetical protein